jgi:uncharacterized membrane protein YgdD (TMEM256/DUF423 family)
MKKLRRRIILTALIIGAFAICLDAFGAHLLKPYISIEQMATFVTGVRYQMYHVFFLFFLSTRKELSLKTMKLIYDLTIFGILLFSGSLYLLSTNHLTVFDFRIIGFATPLGGILLIVAWSYLFFTILRQKS